MGITGAELAATDKTTQDESHATKTTTRTRPSRMSSDEGNHGDVRYFLAKQTTHGSTPELDREVASEAEVLVEALRLGVTYYVLQEFRPVPHFAGRRPQLKKEAVHCK